MYSNEEDGIEGYSLNKFKFYNFLKLFYRYSEWNADLEGHRWLLKYCTITLTDALFIIELALLRMRTAFEIRPPWAGGVAGTNIVQVRSANNK